ncbi:hypothetical protein ABBQ38_006432 [Trebouxia sp. C0009 RCD-2024]
MLRERLQQSPQAENRTLSLRSSGMLKQHRMLIQVIKSWNNSNVNRMVHGTTKWPQIADLLNKALNDKDPIVYRTRFTGEQCNQKERNMKTSYSKEISRRKRVRADFCKTGAATDPSLLDLGSNDADGWPLFNQYRTAFKLGDPTDEIDQLEGIYQDSITESVVPGVAAAANPLGGPINGLREFPGMHLDRGKFIEGQSIALDEQLPSKTRSSMPKPDLASRAQPRSEKAAQRSQDFLKGLFDHTLKEKQRQQADRLQSSLEPITRTDIMQPDVGVLVPPKLPAFMLQPRPGEPVLVSPPAFV